MDLHLSPVSTISEEIYTPSPQYNPPPPSPRKDYHSPRMISPPLKKMKVGAEREQIDYVKFIEECRPYPSLFVEITGCIIPFVIACILSPFI